MSAKVATFVKDVSAKFQGRAEVFAVSPPIETYEDGETFDHVVVSAVSGPYATETYIFGANAEGKILNWGELEGSLRGVVSIDAALEEAGYEVSR